MICIDSNVLLEILEQRRYYQAVLDSLLSKQETLAITTLTTSNVFYIAERNKINFKSVEHLINSYHILDVTAVDVQWALAHYRKDDYEDALQVAAAISAGCTAFLTLDAELAKNYADFLPIELIR